PRFNPRSGRTITRRLRHTTAAACRSEAKMKCYRMLPLALLAVAPLTAAAQQQSDRITLEMYLDMQSVSNPLFSPDGRQIVYTRRWIDKMNDRRSSALWIMNADGSRNRYLLTGSSPQWSPDGTRLAYIGRGEPGGAQIFVRWMDAEGAESQITRLNAPPSDIRWSPDGK